MSVFFPTDPRLTLAAHEAIAKITGIPVNLIETFTVERIGADQPNLQISIRPVPVSPSDAEHILSAITGAQVQIDRKDPA